MRLPKKINPDNIREAVVEVKYISNLPFEVLIGIFYTSLSNDYKYTNRPIQRPINKSAFGNSLGQGLTIQIGTGQFLFYNQKITILINPNSVVFACLNEYLGWENYRQEIEKALNILQSTGQIRSWVRAGLRYLSEYPDKELKECINFNFSFGLPKIQSETTAFRSEFLYNGFKVVLNLNNKLPSIKRDSTKQSEIVYTSIVDIDVIAENIKIQNVSELIKVIDDCHQNEKEIYFTMLLEEYLSSLNPQY